MSGTLIANLPAATTVLANDLMIVEEVGAPNVTKRATAAQVLANALPLTGGVINGTVEIATGSLLLDNAIGINAKDNGATVHSLLSVGPDNNVNLVNSAGARTRILNQAGTTELISTDNLGNVGIASSLSVAGFQAVLNNGGTYSISVTFATSASNASAVPWGGVTGKPYAFNQSADIGASPSFGNVEANNFYLGAIGGTSFWGNSTNPVIQLVTGVYFSYNSGNPVLNLNPNNFVEYNTNMVYNTTGQHIFQGGFVSINAATTGPFTGGYDYTPAGPAVTPPQTVPLSLGCSSSIIATSFFAQSDERVKSDISEISLDEAEKYVLGMRPVTYIKQGVSEAGLVAQDVIRAGYGNYVFFHEKEGMPEVTYPDGLHISADTILELDRSTPVAYLLAFCKKQAAEMASLRERIAALESK